MDLDDLSRLLRTTHVQAQAVVDTVREPLLVLDRELTVLSASRSFYETFGVGRDDTLGRHLYELGNGQWDIPDLRHLLEAVIPRSTAVEGYEVEHDFPGLGRRAVLLHARRLSRPDNNSAALLLAVEDVTERRRGERERELRYGELRHRVKNLLATVEALANQTEAAGCTAEEYRAAFLGRLGALMRAHELAFAAEEGGGGAGGGTGLAALVAGILEPYTAEAATVELEGGPAAALAPRRAQALALVLHELATNAVKHGALSAPGGRVRVGWAVEEVEEVEGAGGARLLRLRWAERGGPQVVAPPVARGFGTRLIEAVARHELDGGAELTFAPEGLRAEVTALLG